MIDTFIEHAPTQVVDAMRSTITGLLGTLPPQHFDVSVNACGQSLANLFLSVLMTGYLLCNAQHRMDLARQLGPAGEEGREPRGLALQTASFDSEEEVLYAPGTQKTRVSGDVVRWHVVNGAEAVPAADYIQSLEDEIRVLRQQAAARRLQPRSAPGNELLEYLRTLEPHAVAELTAGADSDILEAMNTMIYRVLGATDEDLRNIPSESNAIELARLLFFLCVVAYNMRTIEMRWDTEQTMLLSEEPGSGRGYLPG
ncbi:hypothetical protein WJX81_006243 [Elliptochloris bilobata]|uniref:Uncharacterized protein n=1 Tax=Elliptochloris bilobata TaxID=381761 RepID=A0AAW1S973_9CHLO